MGRNLQNSGDVGCTLPERYPTQTLELPGGQVWPVITKYFEKNAAVEAIGNLYQIRLSFRQKIYPISRGS